MLWISALILVALIAGALFLFVRRQILGMQWRVHARIELVLAARPSDVRGRLERIAEHQGWTVTDGDGPAHVVIACAITQWTLRKRVDVAVVDRGASTEVRATCSAPQRLDWGDCSRTLDSIGKALRVYARQPR